MEQSRILTIDEVRDGLVAAADWRRFWVWHGIRLAGVMGGGGLLILAIGYFVQGQVSPWGLLIPAGLVATVLPSSIFEARHFTRMMREFQAAQRRALAGGVVHAVDVPSLSRRPAA